MQIEIVSPRVDKIVTEKLGSSLGYNFSFEIKDTENITESVLSKNKLARNSNEYLVLMVWVAQHKAKRIDFEGKRGTFIPDEFLYDLMKVEAITRCRRSINSDLSRPIQLRYLPDDEVVAKRRGRELDFNKVFTKKEDMYIGI